MLTLAAGACSQGGGTPDAQLGVSASPRVVSHAGRVPKGGGVYKVGNPYKVGGRWYVPRADTNYNRSGVASWYGAAFHGRRTANGEVYDMHALTAGHPTLPLPSYAYVTNLDNGRTILVRVNDRGPYVKDRIIDLSKRSANELGYTTHGLARVRVRYAGRAPLNGNDAAEHRHLAAQPWHGGRLRVAERALPATQARERAIAPSWSIDTYRKGLAVASPLSASGTQRSGLGGPPHTYVEVGRFPTRANAERMRHELKGLARAEVVALQVGAEPSFGVRLGPFAGSAAADVAGRVAAVGIAGGVIVRE